VRFAVHAQYRGVVSFVVDPSTGGQQLRETYLPDQLFMVVAVSVKNVWFTLMIVPSGAVDR
jgi:hypothetical protein